MRDIEFKLKCASSFVQGTQFEGDINWSGESIGNNWCRGYEAYETVQDIEAQECQIQLYDK